MGSVINLSSQEIAKRLSQAAQPDGEQTRLEFPSLLQITRGEPRPAAVLIPLLVENGDWHVLFTRRHADLPEHSGQVAFPGGRTDPEDVNLEATALREAWEEIGIRPEDVQILGKLPRFLTITNYLVQPVVGQIPWPYPLMPAPVEVSRIFTIPLDWLADPNNREERHRALPTPFDPVTVIYFKEYDGEVLWGASARFLVTFLEILLSK